MNFKITKKDKIKKNLFQNITNTKSGFKNRDSVDINKLNKEVEGRA
jgi:hypothetical protein